MEEATEIKNFLLDRIICIAIGALPVALFANEHPPLSYIALAGFLFGIMHVIGLIRGLEDFINLRIRQKRAVRKQKKDNYL